MQLLNKEMSTVYTTADMLWFIILFINMTLYKKEASFNISSAILCILL